MDVERVVKAYVSSREHAGRVALGEADVAQESLVQNGVEDGTVVVATLSVASDGRAGCRGAVRGSGLAHALSIDRLEMQVRKFNAPVAVRGTVAVRKS
jgi:hypothetical protein